ncbi:hypothetical protein MMC07_000042 [Pseudocyphellaria aurata]|nr:hypothetical protein [Pseudocyphellaria aurata]
MRKKDYEAMLAHPEDISFTRLFFGLGPKTHKEPKTVAPAPLIVDIKMPPATDTPASPPPAKAAPTPAPSDPPAAVETPAPQPSAAASEPAPAAPPATDTEAAVDVPIWTDVQDALLIGLKAINKTWKEIGALMPGKDTEDLRERYAELTAAKSEGGAADATVDGVKTPDTTEDETERKKEGNKRKDKKNNSKNKNNGEAGKHGDNSEQGSGNAKKDKQGKEKGKQPKGILKPDDDDAPQNQRDDGAPAETIYSGHSIIFIDHEAGLSPKEVSRFVAALTSPRLFFLTPSIIHSEIPSSYSQNDFLKTKQLLHLSNFHQRLESDKWLQLSSKLFDKTGKRIAPDVLQDSFKKMGLI